MPTALEENEPGRGEGVWGWDWGLQLDLNGRGSTLESGCWSQVLKILGVDLTDVCRGAVQTEGVSAAWHSGGPGAGTQLFGSKAKVYQLGHFSCLTVVPLTSRHKQEAASPQVRITEVEKAPFRLTL